MELNYLQKNRKNVSVIVAVFICIVWFLIVNSLVSSYTESGLGYAFIFYLFLPIIFIFSFIITKRILTPKKITAEEKRVEKLF
jgi:hypothetical protein